MNSWPWKDIEDLRKEEEAINKVLDEEKQKIYNHFKGDVLVYSEWIADNFTSSALMQNAANILLKYGYCERCSYYIGTNPIHRRVFNISVLSAYCTRHADITTPEFKCNYIEFDPFWKQIMEVKLAKLPRYVFPMDKKVERDRQEFKKKWDSGYYDQY